MRSDVRCVFAGSVGFKDALSGNQHWFEGTQLVVISNTQWVGETMPCLTYGMRGMIALSIEVSLAFSAHLVPFILRLLVHTSCPALVISTVHAGRRWMPSLQY